MVVRDNLMGGRLTASLARARERCLVGDRVQRTELQQGSVRLMAKWARESLLSGSLKKNLFCLIKLTPGCQNPGHKTQ